ncbi:lachesin-like [Parasteatoda tepidariorum]|uniref:lachesin-like n=1 Tax=Parasteatoda tepidariorum TaxID=114398 RepID=UPI001C724B52|nr:lachesin-like isoform X2 [Parasteatoda tepidariorum]
MCQVNTVPMLSQIGYLDVVVPPDIIDTDSSSDVLAREGSDVTLVCKAKGYPSPTISWRREDYQPVAAGNWQEDMSQSEDSRANKNTTVHKGEKLTIQKVSRLHMGAYLCIASNGVPPSVSRRIMLQVNFTPMIWIPNQLIGAPIGGKVTLDCHTEAHPESINYWTREEGEMVLQSPKTDVIQKVTTYKVHMILTIHRLVHSDFGTYRCYAKNSLGSTEGSIRLYEIHVPQQVKEPSTAKIQSVDGTSVNGDISDPDGELVDDTEFKYANSSMEVTGINSSSILSNSTDFKLILLVLSLILRLSMMFQVT